MGRDADRGLVVASACAAMSRRRARGCSPTTRVSVACCAASAGSESSSFPAWASASSRLVVGFGVHRQAAYADGVRHPDTRFVPATRRDIPMPGSARRVLAPPLAQSSRGRQPRPALPRRDQGTASSAAAIAGARREIAGSRDLAAPMYAAWRIAPGRAGSRATPLRRHRRGGPSFASNAANQACHAASSIRPRRRVQHRPREAFALAEHVGVAVGGCGLRSHRGERAFEPRAVERGIEREHIAQSAPWATPWRQPARFRSRGNRGPIRR